MRALPTGPYPSEELLVHGHHYFAEFSFRVPELDALVQADAWLSGVMSLEPVTDGVRKTALPGERANAFVQQVGLACNHLLVLGRIPAFNLPRVLNLTEAAPDQASFRCQLGFEVLDHVDWNAYLHVLGFAMQWLQQVSAMPVSGDTLQAQCDEIQRKVIDPLCQTAVSGKSTMPVLQQAHALGIPFIHLGAGVYQLGWGSKARRMDRSTTEEDSAIGSRLVHSKVTCAGVLRMAGLPAPVHEVVKDANRALQAARRIAYPAVVKPADRERGEGVCVDINTDEALQAAFQHAFGLSPAGQVIVERQVQGVCHRLFVAHGDILYAVKRLPMSVPGDGVHTVAELVDEAVSRNKALPPWRRSEIQPLDELAMQMLTQQGLTPDTVPEAGVLVSLRRIESTQWGGVDEEVTNRIHPENRSIAIRAAELFGLQVAGIDIITPDIAVPWFDNGAIINEVNFAPLLGGGDISRRQIATFLKVLVEGDGRIPVVHFKGERAMSDALQRQWQLVEQGLRCCVTSASETFDHHGKKVIMPLVQLRDRVKAMICRRDVDVLLVVT